MRLLRTVLMSLAGTIVTVPVLAGPQSTVVGAAPATEVSGPVNSELSAELFYQLVLGELNLRASEPGAAFSLFLDAARKTDDAQLYQRAVEIALQSRSGEAALQAARAWKINLPQSREANRYVLQILLGLNRLEEVNGPLRAEMALAPPSERSTAILSLARLFSRVSDKKAAAQLVEGALAVQLQMKETAGAAWSTVGRLRLNAGDVPAALEAARHAAKADADAQEPVLLSLALVEAGSKEAEDLVRAHLQRHPQSMGMRLGLARAFLNSQRYPDALVLLEGITRERPDFAEAWLILGLLQAEGRQVDVAYRALERYIELTTAEGPVHDSAEAQRGRIQALATLARLAGQKGDAVAAQAWLGRIDNAAVVLEVQARRADDLARKGDMQQARALIQSVPAVTPQDMRARWVAEMQLLRDHKRYREALEPLALAQALFPEDVDLLYDQAMLAERLQQFDESERVLRRVMQLKPDYHQAYNALGYAMADRGVRLHEARQLILKALEFTPDDPLIQDSLGWVEFRLGNLQEARAILEKAYKGRADADIAAHLGEVLWRLDLKEKALARWREGLQTQPDNDTLLETLQRLNVKP